MRRLLVIAILMLLTACAGSVSGGTYPDQYGYYAPYYRPYGYYNDYNYNYLYGAPGWYTGGLAWAPWWGPGYTYYRPYDHHDHRHHHKGYHHKGDTRQQRWVYQPGGGAWPSGRRSEGSSGSRARFGAPPSASHRPTGGFGRGRPSAGHVGRGAGGHRGGGRTGAAGGRGSGRR